MKGDITQHDTAKCQYTALPFFNYVSPDSHTEVTRGWTLTHNGSKHAKSRKNMPSILGMTVQF